MLDDPAALRRRMDLLADLLGSPDEVVATAVEEYRRSHPGWRRADFEEIAELLRRESDAVIMRLRESTHG